MNLEQFKQLLLKHIDIFEHNDINTAIVKFLNLRDCEYLNVAHLSYMLDFLSSDTNLLNEINDEVVNTIIKNFGVWDIPISAGPKNISNPYLTKTIFTYTNPELESVKLPNLELAHPSNCIISSNCDKIKTIDVPNLLPAVSNEAFFIYNCFGNRYPFEVFVNAEMYDEIDILAHNNATKNVNYAKDILKHLKVVAKTFKVVDD